MSHAYTEVSHVSSDTQNISGVTGTTLKQACGAKWQYTNVDTPDGIELAYISETPIEYCAAGSKSLANPGCSAPGTQGASNSYPGVVIVRVPVANDNTGGTGSTPASVVAAVEQAKETAKETIKRNRRNK